MSRADRQRKRIPDGRSRRQERALTKRLGRDAWGTEFESVRGGPECSCRRVKMDKLGKVRRARTMNGVKSHAGNFVLDSCFNREPVQRVKVGGHVISSGNF